MFDIIMKNIKRVSVLPEKNPEIFEIFQKYFRNIS